ncbi:hypothetical protein GCM10017559_11160 [Streptosporangium longisporum]|uniref:Uncharacterized protein n=1 Tax=Streptosporangium longisporum TaxID=46187 RepID=A0ABN3XSG3_9ACTN
MEMTIVLVTTRSWSERQKIRRTRPAARRVRRRAPRSSWRGVRRRLFGAEGITGSGGSRG